MGVMMRRMTSDPAGFYARLEVEPDGAARGDRGGVPPQGARPAPGYPERPATSRRSSRMKEAYDVLGDAERRAAYDRAARAALMSRTSEVQIVPPRDARSAPVGPAGHGVGGAWRPVLSGGDHGGLPADTAAPPPATVVARPFAPSGTSARRRGRSRCGPPCRPKAWRRITSCRQAAYAAVAAR